MSVCIECGAAVAWLVTLCARCQRAEELHVLRDWINDHG